MTILILVLIVGVLYYLLKPPSIGNIATATPHFPIVGNAIAYGKDPLKFLAKQRARYGDVFLVNLGILRAVFFLGPQGTTAILKGWFEISHRIMQKSLPDPGKLRYWVELARPMAAQKFKQWAETGRPVQIFREMSGLVLRVVLAVFMGLEFVEKYGDEVVPMVREYERMLAKIQPKIFPRWMSHHGRTMDKIEARIKVMVDEEVTERLYNPDKYEKNQDYLQDVVNTVGDKYFPGTTYRDNVELVYPLHILTLLIGAHINQEMTFNWSLVHALRSPLLENLRQHKSNALLSNALLEASFREVGRLYTNLILMRRLTAPQTLLGKQIPKGTYVICSPLATARDPILFPDPDKFRPERWLTDSGELDTTKLRDVDRFGASTQFGRGQHACLGEKLAKLLVFLYWSFVLGDENEPGLDVEIISGIKDGVGIDNVGVEAAWAQENVGTPSEKASDEPLMIRFKKRI